MCKNLIRVCKNIIEIEKKSKLELEEMMGEPCKEIMWMRELVVAIKKAKKGEENE